MLNSASPRQVWAVGALCHAAADTLEARFNPVTVQGELSGFSQASSGHCYFTLKDTQGQLRCAMFRRAANLLDFQPKEGDQVELRGRLGIYEARGDLQLVVESMARAGMGTLFEQFLQRKAKLEAEGLFAPDRKREVPPLPRGIGVVTSLGAAALHDVLTALRRRVPHIRVCLVPASVQGAQAPQEMVLALRELYHIVNVQSSLEGAFPIDAILLVRGGGSLEDLWAFNDEALVRTIVQSPVPLICGVGHETDFTLADFAADLRAPTPTAAAEMVATAREVLQDALATLRMDLQNAVQRQLDVRLQQLDLLGRHMGRPSGLVQQQCLVLSRLTQRMTHALQVQIQRQHNVLVTRTTSLGHAKSMALRQTATRLENAALGLHALDPRLVLRRGYAWLATAQGEPISTVTDVNVGQDLFAHLADGSLELTTRAIQPNSDRFS